MLVYWLLYKFSARLDAGKPAWWVGLIAWLLAGGVARMLSTNMTLMLRPDAWRDVLRFGDGRVSAHGRSHADAALAADDGGRAADRRVVAGVSPARSTFTAEEKKFVAGLGGKVAAGFGLVYLAAGMWAASVQPAAVKAGLAGQCLYPAYRFEGTPATDGSRWWWWPCWWARSPDSARWPPDGWRGPEFWWRCCSRSCWWCIATACAM